MPSGHRKSNLGENSGELDVADDAHLYLGRAGQLAVMSELPVRGLNVAIPEVDTGEDVFVVRRGEESVVRVQVKAATANPQRDGYYAQFHLSLRQLEDREPTRLVYVFAARFEQQWVDYVVISRPTLLELRVSAEIGSLSGTDDLIVRLAFSTSDVQCKGISLQKFRNGWQPWPPK
jgi:hypothetical protein